MKVKVTVTKDTATSAIMQHFYFYGVSNISKRKFIEIVRGYIFNYGESVNHDIYSDYEQFYFEALEVVEKYYK